MTTGFIEKFEKKDIYVCLPLLYWLPKSCKCRLNLQDCSMGKIVLWALAILAPSFLKTYVKMEISRIDSTFSVYMDTKLIIYAKEVIELANVNE